MASAEVHVLNVDHGDSVVVKVVPDDHPDPKWILVDCNTVKRGQQRVCPAFDFLVARGVSVLDLVVVTHLHADHYRGMDRILETFEVRKLGVPPFLTRRSKAYAPVLAKIKHAILETAGRAGSNATVNEQIKSLAAILQFIRDNDDRWEELTGPGGHVDLYGTSLGFRVHLPLKRQKGLLMQRLEDPGFSFESFSEMNDSSVVLSLDIEGTRVLLGADAPGTQWQEHRRYSARNGKASLEASVFKVPHHGSRYDANGEVFEYVLAAGGARISIVSADGRHHPHDEFFSAVRDHKLRPYCTSLAAQCGGDAMLSMEGLADVPADMRPFLLNYGAHRAPVPCQGNVTALVDGDGVQMRNATGVPCIYELGVPRPRWSAPLP